MTAESILLDDQLQKIKESSKKPVKFVLAKDHSLKLSENCIKKISDFQAENPDKLIRIIVEGGGCQGFQYKFIDDSISSVGLNGRDTLLCLELSPPSVLSKPIVVFDFFSEFYIKDSTLDYENSLLFQGFSIKNNPKAKASCGCKKSFSSDEFFESTED